ncbi:MAG: hypothetical protein J0M07_08305 [Anaerolineae bacterium]|nr:hypothetical protein [Anaerolineae bacterium]
MTTQRSRRPFLLLVLLSAVLLFTAFGGIFGGIQLINDPTGSSMNMPLSALERTPFRDYTLPGYILMFVYGFGGVLSVYGLWTRARLPYDTLVSHWTHEFWAWDTSLLLGFVLMIWLTYQVIFYPAFAPIQFVMYGAAILLIGLPLLDPLREYFREEA